MPVIRLSKRTLSGRAAALGGFASLDCQDEADFIFDFCMFP
jgi:hypothetical protein